MFHKNKQKKIWIILFRSLPSLNKSQIILNPTYFMDEPILMQHFRNGEGWAFKEIYERTIEALSKYAKNKCLTLRIDQPDVWEDVVAASFYKLFLHRANFKEFDYIRRWLWVISKNEIIDIKRRETAYRKSGLHKYWEDIFGDCSIPFSNHSISPYLAKALSKLNRRHKQVIDMYFFKRMTTQEISEALHIDPQTALNHKTKAIDKMIKTIAPYKEYILI